MNVRRDNIFEIITGELSSVDGLLSPNVKVLFIGNYSKKLFPVWNWQTIYQLKDLVITKRAGTSVSLSRLSTTKNCTPSKVSDCPDLFSNHEETDTCMLLHAIHADARFGDMNVKGHIITKSTDTDVLLLCIHFFP
jgi:hypothetical protein